MLIHFSVLLCVSHNCLNIFERVTVYLIVLIPILILRFTVAERRERIIIIPTNCTRAVERIKSLAVIELRKDFCPLWKMGMRYTCVALCRPAPYDLYGGVPWDQIPLCPAPTNRLLSKKIETERIHASWHTYWVGCFALRERNVFKMPAGQGRGGGREDRDCCHSCISPDLQFFFFFLSRAHLINLRTRVAHPPSNSIGRKLFTSVIPSRVYVYAKQKNPSRTDTSTHTNIWI